MWGCWGVRQHMRKNQYEEALFRCEDDRFELDMTIEANSSAIRAITPLVQARLVVDALGAPPMHCSGDNLCTVYVFACPPASS